MSVSSDLDRLAHDTLVGNDRGGYTVPNAKVYPFQWNWDSAFVAMGFAVFDEDRAWRELETLFLGQWADGMVPSIVFHKPDPGYYPGPTVWGTAHEPPTTGISQPPVAATAARAVFEASRDKAGAEARLRALFPRLFASHRWWHETRDPDATGLVTVVHPWETGRDNSPEWDEPLARVTPLRDVSALRKDKTHVNAAERPTDDFYNRVMRLVDEAKALGWQGERVARTLSFRVCDIGVQSILMRADRDLLALAHHLGHDAEAAKLQGWIERAMRGFDKLRHDDGSFRSLDLVSGLLAPVATSGSFLPLYARACTKADADRLAQILTEWSAKAVYAVPSTSPDAAAFDPVSYWRGPVWLVVNRLIADGFAAYGHGEVAERIRGDARRLAEAHGLREYFDPRNGAGLGGRDFSWSAAVWLSWLSASRDDVAGRDLVTPE
ncbi:alpha,alpha-trehalase [Rhizobiales bacterium GAS191]|nr:alpha,alpha-trehalase [Rhizobiales bacterium GAS113]SED92373.1 alpha,alpha-trehalase [Rhizobiales bacterium GAS188]SEE58613.1 alpha,alpha-trehalase [Rhizobiales bacterium GAS191]